MSRVLLVSKPIAPPFRDGTLNLVRDLSLASPPGSLEVLTPRGAPPLGAVSTRCIYRGPSGHTLPRGDGLRLLAHLLTRPLPPLLHWFFTPSAQTAALPSRIARLRRRRTVWTLPSAPLFALSPEQVRHVDKLLVMSESTRDAMIANGIDRAKIQTVRPWLAPFASPSEEAKRAVREALGLRRRTTVFCGDLGRGRGHDLSLAAFARIATDDDCLVIAARPKGEQAQAARRTLVRQVEALGMGPRVRIADTVPDMRALLACADVVLLPATNLHAKVDVPLVLLEALALGRAVVVAENSPPADLAHRGAACAVRPEVLPLARALDALLNSPHDREALGVQGHAVWVRDHSAELAAHTHALVYDTLLAQR